MQAYLPLKQLFFYYFIIWVATGLRVFFFREREKERECAVAVGGREGEAGSPANAEPVVGPELTTLRSCLAPKWGVRGEPAGCPTGCNLSPDPNDTSLSLLTVPI